MRRKHQRTLQAIFRDPVQANINWRDIEALIFALGGEVNERSGSRVMLYLNGVRGRFHRPHPQKETDKGAIKSLRDFLRNAGYDK